MSRQNKVNPGMYTQRGRLTQDDAAREIARQRTVSSPHSWEKAHNDEPSSPPTRIQVVALPTPAWNEKPRALVESRINDGWGRRREILLSALNNKPSGYRLVRDVEET